MRIEKLPQKQGEDDAIEVSIYGLIRLGCKHYKSDSIGFVMSVDNEDNLWESSIF